MRATPYGRKSPRGGLCVTRRRCTGVEITLPDGESTIFVHVNDLSGSQVKLQIHAPMSCNIARIDEAGHVEEGGGS